MEAAMATWILAWLIVPAWISAGALDWLCHRRGHIERTAGSQESLLHLLMFAEVGLPLLAVLLLEVNALIFVVAIVGFAVHEATSLWDVTYASRHREITPFEQHVHSFLELLPLTAILLLAVMHPGQMLALMGLGSERANFFLAWKQPPLPVGYLAVVFGAATAFALLPFVEELVRGLRARRAGRFRMAGQQARQSDDVRPAR